MNNTCQYRKIADQKRFRVAVFIDVNAADEEDAKGQVEEMIAAIPNSYIGDIIDMSNPMDLFGEDGGDSPEPTPSDISELGGE